MYVDGHERTDVVAYRTQFLERMKIYEPFMPQFVGPEMESEIWPARDAIILVTHDESTFAAHVGQKKLWFPDGEQPLRKKGAGRSIHVSEFLTDVVTQCKDLFAFDNASSHAAFAEDAIVSQRMNLGPVGKQPVMWNGMFGDGKSQSMVLPAYHPLAGQPKSIKTVLQERNLWIRLDCRDLFGDSGATGSCCGRSIIPNQPDFKAQKDLLEETITVAGHLIICYPKFHCEFNFLESFWEEAQRYARKNCDYTWKGLVATVSKALASVSLAQSFAMLASASFIWMCIGKI
ncbi:unnamed protein product [Albugo candida]|uniref:Uncharacterized protein n=1 Tax=Albugo candida TaxID=65357 RepID=A0A024FUX6_9STRA|nr:unnamed protein product [Albugo candida]|eukprot:CCI10948.1 unnamed protein product [Albugo candida]